MEGPLIVINTTMTKEDYIDYIYIKKEVIICQQV